MPPITSQELNQHCRNCKNLRNSVIILLAIGIANTVMFLLLVILFLAFATGKIIKPEIVTAITGGIAGQEVITLEYFTLMYCGYLISIVFITIKILCPKIKFLRQKLNLKVHDRYFHLEILGIFFCFLPLIIVLIFVFMGLIFLLITGFTLAINNRVYPIIE